MGVRVGRLAALAVVSFFLLSACPQLIGGGDSTDSGDRSNDESDEDQGSSQDNEQNTPPAIVAIECQSNPEFVDGGDGTYQGMVNLDFPDLDNPLYFDFVLDGASESHEQTVYFRLLDNGGTTLLPSWLELVENSGRIEVDTSTVQEQTQAFGFYSSYNADPENDDAGGATKDSPLNATFAIFVDSND